MLLPANQRERLRFVEKEEEARYMMSHFRCFPGEFPPERDVYSITIDGGKILVVQRLD